jgi:hypothetical protein
MPTFSKLFRLVALTIPLGVLGGCAIADEPLSDEAATDDADGVTARRVLLCQQGLSDRTMEWDKGLFDICEAAEAAGMELVRDGDFPAFGALDQGGAYQALFDKLDVNNDGYVTKQDGAASVYLVGFSWGGINVTDIADWMRRDGNISTPRKGVAAMVLLDAFQPQISRARIPSNVSRAWVYRQTDTTSGDCSTYASLGFGFNGHRPLVVSETTRCSMYDLDGFAGAVGHCDVPVVARKAAIENLTEQVDFEPWAEHAVDCPTE